MNMFRELNKDEEKEFRQWAQDNYEPGDEIKETWHPVVRDECLKMNGGNMPEDEKESELPTVQEQAEIFGATDWKYCGKYVFFYNGGVFVGSSNMDYLKVPKNN